MKAEDYIKEKWGDEWLTHNWEAGDVIDALEEFASLKSQLSEAGEEKEKYCSYCKYLDIFYWDDPCRTCNTHSNWQPR